MRAAENLDGNDSLSRSEPLVLQYVGKGEEAKISEDWIYASVPVYILIVLTVEDLRQRKLTNGLGHSAMLIGGIEEEEES